MRNKTSRINCKGAVYCAPTMLIIFMLALSACSSTNADNDATQQAPVMPTALDIILPESDWGSVELIAQAEQLSAPVFLDTGFNTIFTWTGSDNTLARHFSRGIDGNHQVVDLIAFFPQEQQLLPISQGAMLFWLDRTNEGFDSRLQVAKLSFDGERVAGATPITQQRTRNYTAIALSPSQFRVVASEGLGEVTNLYLYHVDDSTRPTGSNLLQIDGDYPGLIRDNEDNLHLFWLSNNGRDAYHARFNEIGNPELVDIQHIASNNLSVTDAITGFSVGFDGQYAYLLWNIRRIDDSQLILMSSGQLNDERYSTPAPFITESGEAIQWVYPAGETQSPLPLVANTNEDLLLLWMQDGLLQEREFITNSGHLIGVPHIVTTGERIGVSWSQATDKGYANLFYVSRSHN